MLLAAMLGLGLSACGGGHSHAASAARPAASGPGPETIFTAGSALVENPTATVDQLHALGVDRVRIFLPWASITRDGTAARKPSFDATNPAAYPASHWASYDTIIRTVLAHHMGLDVVLGPPPPRWATGSGAPAGKANAYGDEFWEPNATEFEQFVRAVGTRYSGHYTPKGASKPLPRVSFWSVWNEPNSGVQLAPQATANHQTEVAPRFYRALVDAAWTGLHATGHGSDTFLIGELAPIGSTGPSHPGNFDVMQPLRFLRALYCVGANDAPLSGSAASVRGCPTSSSASKRFPGQNPALFKATAFAAHPYSFALSPSTASEPGNADLAQIASFFSTLDRTQQAYGSSRHFDAYETEYGFITDPPNGQTGKISPSEAAKWINWGEYLTWRNPRLLSYDQYLLADPTPVRNGKPYGGFASGILTYSDVRKPGFYAFRMPVWLPATSAGKGAALEVWGGVRPAKLIAAVKRPPALVQWRAKTGNAWRTIARVSTRTRYGYFDVHEHFPGSGQVRVSWTAPGQPAIHSRVTAIRLG